MLVITIASHYLILKNTLSGFRVLSDSLSLRYEGKHCNHWGDCQRAVKELHCSNGERKSGRINTCLGTGITFSLMVIAIGWYGVWNEKN